MPTPLKILGTACVAFCLPIVLIVMLRWEDVRTLVVVAPETAEGHLIYFTSYG